MSKKTETIEIRVSPEMKSALADTSAKADKTMSAYLRDLVEDATSDTPNLETGAYAMTKILPKSFSGLTLAALPVLAVAGFALVGSTSATVASPEFRVIFAEMDADGNGQISKDEFTAYYMPDWPADDAAHVEDPIADLPAACAALDENVDDSEDFVADDFAYFDSNGDVTVTYEEMSAVLQRERVELFLDFDANADGVVTQDEVVASLDMVEGDMDVELTEGEQACLTALEALDGEQSFAAEAEMFEDALEDFDAEAEARLMIAEYDTNRDGQLSLQEMLEN